MCGIVQAAAAAQQQWLAASAAALRREVQGLLRDGMTIMTTSLSSTLLTAIKEAAGVQLINNCSDCAVTAQRACRAHLRPPRLCTA